MDIATKKCPRCENVYPLTLEHFAKNNKNNNGFSSYCRRCHSQYVKEWRQKHPEESKKIANTYYRKRYGYATFLSPEEKKKHERESARQSNRRARAKNPQRYRDHQRKWQLKYPEKNRTKARRYWAKKHGAIGSHTSTDVELQIKAQTNKKGQLICWWCDKPIKDKYQVDHRIPLSKGGTDWPNNLVITHKRCNCAKRDAMPHEKLGRLL